MAVKIDLGTLTFAFPDVIWEPYCIKIDFAFNDWFCFPLERENNQLSFYY